MKRTKHTIHTENLGHETDRRELEPVCWEKPNNKTGFFKSKLVSQGGDYQTLSNGPNYQSRWLDPPGLLPRLSTRRHSHPLRVFSFISCLKLAIISSPTTPNPAPIRLSRVRRFTNHVRHAQIRSVSQGVVCVHRVYLDNRLFFWVCLLVSKVFIVLGWHLTLRGTNTLNEDEEERQIDVSTYARRLREI